MSTDIVSVFRAPIELEEYWSEIHQNIDSLDVKVQQVAERLLPSYRDLQVKVSSGMSSTFRFFLQETLMTCQNRFRGTVLDGSDDLSTSLVVSWQTQEHQGRGPYAAMSGLGRTTGRTLHPDRKSTCPPCHVTKAIKLTIKSRGRLGNGLTVQSCLVHRYQVPARVCRESQRYTTWSLTASFTTCCAKEAIITVGLLLNVLDSSAISLTRCPA